MSEERSLMKEETILGDTERHGVFAVPPLARKTDARRSIDFDENDRLVRHIATGGMTRVLYGGNAFLYHVTLGEYEELLGWMAGLPAELLPIPSLGPSFGRALDQAALLRRHRFRCVMALPCNDPRDAAGLETGLREIADAAGLGLTLYVKEETSFGADRIAGLDAIARLARDGICVGVKYAVVRGDAGQDPYLDALLERVDRKLVISGIGERPAVTHLDRFGLQGFTTGSGCLAPQMSGDILRALDEGDTSRAEELRSGFIPLEDLRDRWGPARVIHAALDLAGVARTGPIPPFVSALDERQRAVIAPVARQLLAAEQAHRESR
jgi:dihydrodipicolinate synthase/N-acetylneuraminate lyase